ncbi:MAG TPA: potassium/proton antiporter [Spirochaetales bacterium]|nr:potassium/proton antiporter [Spirochaetales bacterium]HRY53812.1 potassium/proton antiporter [Spirochaetia bacterium]HRZ65101.1 potassium/proton antiporter [Spirochaetia bacterium]
MIFLFAAMIVAAVFSTKLSSRFGVPVLIAFIGLGILVGSDVLNFFYFDDALLTKRLADGLLVFIIFVGGFQTKRSALRSVAKPALGLATVGVLATAGLLGLLVHFVGHYSLAQSLMIASIISSTDAAAVMLITRQNPIRERVAATLDVESAANDPMAILLTLACVQLAAGSGRSPALLGLELVWQLGGGVLVGYAVSRASVFLFDRLESENRGYYYVLVIGVILLAYGLASIARANGIIAVFFMGYWLGNAEFVGKRGVSNFLEGISAFSNLSLFLMLGLLAFPSRFPSVWREGLAIACLLIFIVRPLVVLACAMPFKYEARELALIAWGGIKGAVPIVLATYPAAYGLDPEGEIFNIIFFAVLLSCLVQGLSMGPLARRLGLTLPAKPHSPHSVELHSLRKSDIDMFELRVEAGSIADGLRIRDLVLPADLLISSIVRDKKIVPPRGATILRAQDLLFILAPAAKIEEVSASLNARRADLDPEQEREREIEERR